MSSKSVVSASSSDFEACAEYITQLSRHSGVPPVSFRGRSYLLDFPTLDESVWPKLPRERLNPYDDSMSNVSRALAVRRAQRVNQRAERLSIKISPPSGIRESAADYPLNDGVTNLHAPTKAKGSEGQADSPDAGLYIPSTMVFVRGGEGKPYMKVLGANQHTVGKQTEQSSGLIREEANIQDLRVKENRITRPPREPRFIPCIPASNRFAAL